MNENYEDLTPEQLKEELDSVDEELGDLDTEINLRFKAGGMHVSGAELQELETLRSEQEKLEARKNEIQSAIAKKGISR